VLLAIAIGAIVITIVNTVFYRSHKNIEAVKSSSEIYQTARTVMDRMIKDLTCAYIPADDRPRTRDELSLYRFVGTEEDDENIRKDSIYFTTTTDLGFSRNPGSICEVDYYLKETEDKRGSYTLMRREDSTPHSGITKAGMELEMAEGIKEMEIVYIDDAKQETREWDLLKKLTLPKRVKVILTFDDGKDGLKFTGYASPSLSGIRLRVPEG
jgi:type II secretory pathway component PulJ